MRWFIYSCTLILFVIQGLDPRICYASRLAITTTSYAYGNFRRARLIYTAPLFLPPLSQRQRSANWILSLFIRRVTQVGSYSYSTLHCWYMRRLWNPKRHFEPSRKFILIQRSQRNIGIPKLSFTCLSASICDKIFTIIVNHFNWTFYILIDR